MRNLRTLLLVTVVVEALAGAAMLVAPAPSTALLLGAPDLSPAPFVMQRLFGASLLSIAVACWIAYSDRDERLGRPLIAGLFVYNVAVPAVLSYAALAYPVASLVLWPACALHLGLAGWGVDCLRVKASETR